MQWPKNVFRGRQRPAKGKEPSSGEQEETPCRGALAILRAGQAAQMQKQQEKSIKWSFISCFSSPK